MANTLEFQKLNPLRMIWQTEKLASDSGTPLYQSINSSYNQINADRNFYFNAIRFHEVELNYIQPFQQSDIICMQFLSTYTTLAHFSARLIDQKGGAFIIPPTASTAITIVKESGTYNGYTCYTLEIPLWNIPEGIYFLQINYNGGGSNNLYNLSEPFNVKQLHKNTIRLDYTNSFNDQSMLWNLVDKPAQIRVKGAITEVISDSQFKVYEDQPLNTELISGIAFNVYELTLAYSELGIPEWMADKLNRVFLCDILKVDGVAYTKEQGSKLEKKKLDRSPITEYVIKLRDRYNLDTYNVAYTPIIVGNMPQTQYFWVEEFDFMNSTPNVLVQNGFKGKKHFLNYLNSTHLTTLGYWAEDLNNKLVFIHYDAPAVIYNFTLNANDVLLYGIRFEIEGSGDLIYQYDAGVSTYSRARLPQGGYTTLTKATYSGTISASYAYSGAVTESFLYLDNALTIVDNSSTIKILSISGDLPPACTTFNFGTSGIKLYSIGSNLFKYVTSLTVLNLQNGKMGTYKINEIILYLWEWRTHLNASCVVTLQGQSPSAPISSDIEPFKGQVKALITTLTTD